MIFFGSIFLFLSPNKPTSTGLNQKCILDTFSNPTFTWAMPLKIRIICKNCHEIAKKMTGLNTNDGFATARLCSFQKGPIFLEL